VSELAHIPAPPESAWVSDWHSFEGECGHHSWVRHFTGRRWTVETDLLDPTDVELVGAQFSDGSIEMCVCIDGALHLKANETLMMAAVLSRAAEGLLRIQGGWQ
jgi:hypothetical protein